MSNFKSCEDDLKLQAVNPICNYKHDYPKLYDTKFSY